MFDIKEHVKDRQVRFVGAVGGNLWYVTELGFEFPVPFDDMGEATFEATDRAMLFMRYIRMHAGRTVQDRFPGERESAGHAFMRARAGNLWYRDDAGFEFPIAYTEMGEDTYPARVAPDRVEVQRHRHLELASRQAA